MPRLLRLPASAGRLLICTDLHGNLGDFRRARDLFVQRLRTHPESHLLFTGDLVHGPNYTRSRWPDYLGTYYEDASGRLLDEFVELQRCYPARVHCLMGNHEHSHIGGPHTPKFWIDETIYFEEAVGPERAARYCDLFRTFHLVAVTACGVAVTHAAPNVSLGSLGELEQVTYDGYEQMSLETVQMTPLLGRLIWSRSCPQPVAQGFLATLGECGWSQHVVVFGHDIVTEGYEIYGEEQLQLSTSFGLDDRNKRYVELDLTASYRSVRDLRVGREILLLHER